MGGAAKGAELELGMDDRVFGRVDDLLVRVMV